MAVICGHGRSSGGPEPPKKSANIGKFMFHMLAAFAEMERALARERTTAALPVAASKGRVGGRKPVMTPDRLEAARELLASGMKPSKVAATIGVSIPTFYWHLPASEQEALAEGKPGASPQSRSV